ncbi:MAG: hypothetical protein WA959_19560, partial [Rivularia sp. (in: cyanobacteria)]
RKQYSDKPLTSALPANNSLAQNQTLEVLEWESKTTFADKTAYSQLLARYSSDIALSPCKAVKR